MFITYPSSLKGCVLMFVGLALPSLLDASTTCNPGVSYLDPVTGHCDPCSDICEFTQAQRTQKRCQDMCPGYKPMLHQCPPQHYYDVNVDRCERCGSLCLHPHTRDDCQKLCPDWSEKNSSVTSSHTEPKVISLANVSANTAERSHATESNYGSLTTGVWIGVGFLAVCALGLVALTAVCGKGCIGTIKSLASRHLFTRHPTQVQEDVESRESLNPIYRPTGRGPIATAVEDV